MKTLQEKDNAVLEGKYPKSQFVRSAQIEVPTFISKFSGFEDSVQILKNKGMIAEAKDEAPEYDKPAPGYNLYDLDRGVDYELEKLGIDTATEVPDEKTHLKAKAKAEKNLEKNPNYYLHILAGDNTPYPDPSQDSHDREVEVDQKKLFKGTVDPKGGKAEGNTDTFNAMKKANLNEATKKELAKLLKEGAVEDLAKKLGIDVDKLQASIDKIKKSEETATAAAAKAAKPTYSEEKIDEGDPIVDEHEFDFFKEILDGRYKDEEIEEYLKSDDYQQALQTLNLDASDTEDWIGEFTNFFGDGADAYIDEGNIKEAVKKVIKHVLKENHQSLDLEVARRIEGSLHKEKKAKFLNAGEDLIKNLLKDDEFFRNDVISHLANELNLHVPIRDLFKEGTLNERVGGLQEFINLIQDRAVDSEFSEEEEALEVIEAIAEHYGIKIQTGGFVGEGKTIDVYGDGDVVVNIDKATPEQERLLDFEFEISEFGDSEEAQAVADQIMSLNSEYDVEDYYANERGWDEDSDLRSMVRTAIDVFRGLNENQDAIKFAQFIHAHGLKDKQIKDEEYLKDLYDNYKESVKENENGK